MLAGYRTYIVSALLLIYGISGLLSGQPVDWQAILEGAGLATLRASIR